MGDSALRGRLALVTGGGGFIGSHLVDGLLALGARVRVLDDFSTGREANLAQCRDRIEVVRGDIRDLDTCHRASRGAALVFHQAAVGSVPRSMLDPATTIAVNVTGTANVFAAARDAGVARVVYASSSSVYGDSERLPKREGEEGRPLSPYASSKLQAEELADVFGRCFGTQIVGLRYFNVYGPRQAPDGPYAAVVPRFLAALSCGEAPVIYGDGEQSRDFIYVEDAVRANLLAATAPATGMGRAYNVAAGVRTTVRELADRLRELAGGPLPRYEAARAGDVRDSQADVEAAGRGLGFTAEVTLAQGLSRTWESFARSVAGCA